MLQCTHHICACHINNVSNHERLACPACADISIVSEGGLPIDRTLQVVVQMWSEQQQPKQELEEQQLPLCGFCEEQPAARRCVQCNGFLCAECERTSHSKGFFRSHNVVDLDLAADRSVDYAGRMLCEDHPEEKLSFYCLDCRRPVCSHCLILGDHKGHEQTPIDQAFETGKETLGAWMEKMSDRIQATEDLLEQLRASELEVNKSAEAQRNTINHEMDHLRELIETKRHQLLSKSALEEKQKRVMLQAQVDRAEAARLEAGHLVGRSQGLLSLTSEHFFLAVLLPLIQDMKKCYTQPVETQPTVSVSFRPLSTDGQVRCLGDLDLGAPRQMQQVQTLVSPGTPGLLGPQLTLDGQQSLLVVQQYGVANATLSYLPQGPVPVQQVQYVYNAVRPGQLHGGIQIMHQAT